MVVIVPAPEVLAPKYCYELAANQLFPDHSFVEEGREMERGKKKENKKEKSERTKGRVVVPSCK